jgi:hypothetical protein
MGIEKLKLRRKPKDTIDRKKSISIPVWIRKTN